MPLKFGIFVLLLAVDGVFSEEKVPTVPTISILSAIQRVPRLRRASLRTHHAPVQGLYSNSFRRSLLATGGACEWDDDSEECSISLSSMRFLLEKSDTDFAQLLLDGVTCVEKMNKKDCNRQEACVWDKVLVECYYGDWRRGHEDSPCAKAVPLFFDSAEAYTACPKLDSGKRCERKKECVWYLEDAICEGDSDFIFFGIKNFGYKAIQLIDSKGPILTSEYKALPSSDNFTWQSYLDYEPSSTECPSDIEPLACEYVDVLLSGILGPHFYCAAKYRSAASECTADVLCMWNTISGKCGHDESLVIAAAEFSAIRVLIDSMPDGQDKRILEAIFACGFVMEKDSCNGTCIWTANSDCNVRDDHLAALLTKAGKNTTDALCTFLAVDGNSDCYTQFTKKNCQRTELCRWNAEGDCEPNNKFYVSAAADRDPKMKERYQILKKQCSRYSTKKTCVEPSKVY